MSGKELFYFLLGTAACLVAGSGLAYVLRTTPTTDDCINGAKGIQVRTATGTACVSKETYREITGEK